MNFQILGHYKGATGYEKQYHRRKRAYGEIAPIYAPAGHVPPFQIPVNSLFTSSATIAVIPVTIDGTELSDKQSEFQLTLSSGYTGYRNLVFLGKEPITLDFGLYWFKITITEGAITEIIHTEVVNITNNDNSFIKVEYWNDNNFILPNGTEFVFGGYAYTTSGDSEIVQFKFWAWLRTELGAPTYPYENIVHTKNMIDYPELITSQKQYQFEVIAGEPFWDGFRLARLHNSINILTDEVTHPVFDLIFEDIMWPEPRFYGIGTIIINTNTIVKSIGKGRQLMAAFSDGFSEGFEI